MAKRNWAADWNIALRVTIERRSRPIVGRAQAELMEAIDRQQTITAAAKSACMSYRRAWMLIQEMNRAAGTALVEAAVGGIKGGGARLTPDGQFALEIYRRLDENLSASAAGVLRQLMVADDRSSACLHLAAAISLQEAMTQIIAAYSLRRPAIRVRAIYGASNELADHILAGAPADLFIAAEESELDRLRAGGKLLPRSRRVVALNDLAIVGRKRSPAIQNLDALKSKKVRHIVLAEPACPLGRYSQRFLKAEGIYDALLPKVIHVDNSRAVVSAVVSGAADAAVAFASDAAGAEQCQMYFRIPHRQAAAQYVGGLTRSSKNVHEARNLLDFIGSSDAATCLRRCGLEPP